MVCSSFLALSDHSPLEPAAMMGGSPNHMEWPHIGVAVDSPAELLEGSQHQPLDRGAMKSAIAPIPA